MDKIDEQIISLLNGDSRIAFLKIAKELNVSEGTVRQRVKKLFDSGEIKKFTILTKQSKSAIIGLKVNTKKNLLVLEKKLWGLSVEKVFHVSGRFDLIVETTLKGKELNGLLDKIRRVDGIEESETFIILEEDG